MESILSNEQFQPEEHLAGLYQDVVLQAVLPDHKTFCDSIPLFPPQEILKAYEIQKAKEGFNLKEFVLQNFKLPPEPAKNFRSNPDLPIRDHIKQLWPILTRKPDDEERSSLIPLPKAYIVPGGRFREIYYWDTYFTMLGLQESREIEMIQNMIDNFTHLVNTMGHIPNGNRSYYSSRSQPPFFALMLDVLAQEKGEETWKIYGHVLRKEYDFWMEGAGDLKEAGESHRRVVKMPNGSVLNRYWDDKKAPRQECYKGDLFLAKESGRSEEEVYVNLRAACESGWDFSSRWFGDEKTLQTVRAAEIIPIDLNCLLYYIELCLAKISRLEGDLKGEECYKGKSEARKKAILEYCWDEKLKFFFDYDFVNNKTTDVPTLAGVYPLYFKIAEPEQAGDVAKKLEKDFLKAGGLVTTLNHSGHQWDAPNGWAPLQWMSIQGLKNYGEDELAETVSQRWVDLNVGVYKRTGKLMEKYNVEDVNLEGGGGKYPNQDGFGWTNGVLLKLLGEESDKEK